MMLLFFCSAHLGCGEQPCGSSNLSGKFRHRDTETTVVRSKTTAVKSCSNGIPMPLPRAMRRDWNLSRAPVY